MTVIHPLSALSAAEIEEAASLCQSAYPEGTKLQFKTITLQEPPKKAIQEYYRQGRGGESQTVPPREAFVNYYIKGTARFHEAIVNLSEHKLASNLLLDAHFHGAVDGEEIELVEKICLENPQVQAEIAKLKLPEGSVVISDPWIWGADGVDDAKRQFQCYMYMRDPANSKHEDSNHYAFPLGFSPVVDTVTMKVTRIEYIPTGADWSVHEPLPYKRTIAPNEYMPDLNQVRTDLKELQVVQPNGASFTVKDNEIHWQKWDFRLGFNAREGMVLYKVSYDGRPLFYRVSLSDMSIPYADPRPPYHKKQAFDLGDAGAGVMANDLKLGCDCLGSIHYVDGLIADENGKPSARPNAVCIHEQDNGIGWKHTNYRTGRAAVVRNRELIIQSIITVSNYEYILAFIFNQAGEMAYEVRATGILSTQPIDPETSVPWGTVVHDGVLAVYHQHILSLRVDPEIDGDDNNRLVIEEAHAIPRDPKTNPHGNGYVTKETIVTKSTGLDPDWTKNRVFKIQNPSKKNPVNNKPVAYKIMAPPFQPILVDPSSHHFKRAEFADRGLYVTKYNENELFSGGKYTNQSHGGYGVRTWAAREDDIVDKDLVLWVQFGMNHIPRVEDFPVMPVEMIKVSFKPVNFFDRNPSIDVAPSMQQFNKSTLLTTDHKQSGISATVNGHVEVNGNCCETK